MNLYQFLVARLIAQPIPPEYVKGADVSRYQCLMDGQKVIKGIDFWKMKAQGVRFILIRGMTIWGEPDYAFEENWFGAKEAGLQRGVYGFCNQEKPIIFAIRLHKIVSDTGDMGELPPVLDYETAKIKPPPPLPDIEAVRNWLITAETYFRRRPIFYTNYNFSIKKPPAWISDYKLWAARYIDPQRFNSPWGDGKWRIPGFLDWTFWQWGTPVWGEQYGAQSKEIDCDFYHGNQAQFEAEFGLEHVMTLEERVMRHEEQLTQLEAQMREVKAKLEGK